MLVGVVLGLGLLFLVLRLGLVDQSRIEMPLLLGIRIGWRVLVGLQSFFSTPIMYPHVNPNRIRIISFMIICMGVSFRLICGVHMRLFGLT